VSAGVSKWYALRRGVRHVSEIRNVAYTSQISRALVALF